MSTKVGLIACVALSSGLLLVSTGKAQDCVGDCNGDGQVSINELVLGVNIALGSLPADACPAFDPNGNDTVAINELIEGVGNALNGCLPPPGFEERVFNIVPGLQFGGPVPSPPLISSRTGLFTDGLAGVNAADEFSEGPLVLMRGPEDENGVSPLSLRDDVFITVTVSLSESRVCIRMLAEGSGGSIACDGGVPYDVEAFQPVGDVGPEFEVRTGLGPAAGPGSANLLVMQQTQPVADADFESCETADYTDPPQLWAYTTELATAIKATTGIDRTLAVRGEPFSCDTFSVPGGQGMLAAPAPAFQSAAGGSVANVFRLADRAAEQ